MISCDHARLQASLRTPICLDESIKSPKIAADALELGACRIINIKPGRMGGFGPSLAVHEIARDRGIPLWHGGMLESGIGRAHNLHLSTLPGFTLPGDVAASRRYFVPDLIDPPIDVRPDGMHRRSRQVPASASCPSTRACAKRPDAPRGTARELWTLAARWRAGRRARPRSDRQQLQVGAGAGQSAAARAAAAGGADRDARRVDPAPRSRARAARRRPGRAARRHDDRLGPPQAARRDHPGSHGARDRHGPWRPPPRHARASAATALADGVPALVSGARRCRGGRPRLRGVRSRPARRQGRDRSAHRGAEGSVGARPRPRGRGTRTDRRRPRRRPRG